MVRRVLFLNEIAFSLIQCQGIDPFIFFGGCTAATMGTHPPCSSTMLPNVSRPGLGIVLGPTAGSYLWRLRNRSTIELFDARDAAFFHRIAKNRVDASLQSPTSPVPDYYGQ